ncbi:ATP-binding cassette sub-family A member 3 [Folsomia candida]|uniref:ATP-binding cassette sub-family A member 3 n=1 Tax=Folsomia candida TaxID=158441 RepID=A0A226DL54_FOLCA|nr:ATP-binding cassette sub-family A member 3 [Folsomia candida]
MGQSVFRRLWLLVWKNLILRKRQYIVTALEIILPTLFAILMAYMRARLRSDPSGTIRENVFPPVTEEQHVVRAQSELLGYSGGDYFYNRTIDFGYSPNTQVVKDFTGKLETQLFTNMTDNENIIIKVNWLGFDTEKELEAYVAEQSQTYYPDKLKFAVVINGLDKLEKISYKLRFLDRFYETTDLMPWIVFSTDCGMGGSNYEYSGFIGVSTNQMPCPPSDGFDFNQLYFLFMPQLMIIGFIFIVPSIVRGIVSEKETGIKASLYLFELMKMTGIPNWMHWVGWMINSLLVLIISITLVIILLYIPFNSSTGGVLKNSDPTIWWFFLFCYAIWATSYCFLISSIFERPTLATTIGIVVWIVTYYGVSLPLESRYSRLSLAVKMLLCLSPNMGLHYGLKVLSAFEAKKGIGAQWKNIGKSASSIDSLALGHVLLMLLIASILYIFLAMYLESILPTKYGVRKPWYFIFMPSTWGFRKDKMHQDVATLRSETSSSEGESFEKANPDLKVGVEVLKLRKQFQEKLAVDDVSFKAYEGQIFCLLGHNGAGKTTTMSVLTGLLSATGGTALINGKDIKTEMDEIRQTLGLCPQHNLLFSKLTVKETLKFFGMAKGLTSSQAEGQIPPLIEKLQLVEKTNALAMSLSGGQKRRLSLGGAIIGDSKVLFIDECSSGLDPEARRFIWDLLLDIRNGRTIILTTHFLEEADCLANRIGIMASGQVKCCGSPQFLKKYYGTGYTLSLGLGSDRTVNTILQIVQQHIPDAFIKSNALNEGVTVLEISLPSAVTTSQFPTMFRQLLSQQDGLEILDVAISLTTMDDVFIKVEELSHSSETENVVGFDPSTFKTSGGRSTGVALLFQQFWGLMLKKIMYSFRRWKLTVCQMVIPIAVIIAAVLITNLTYATNDRTPALVISLNSYYNQIARFSISGNQNSKDLGERYAKVVVTDSSKGVESYPIPEGVNLTSEFLRLGRDEEESYFQRHLVGAELNSVESLNAMYSSIPSHVQPLSVNLITNSMLDFLSGGGGTKRIEVINHPLTSGMQEIYDAASPDPFFSEVAPFVVGVLVSIGLALLAASFVVMPIEERKSKCKQLQLMTGVNPFVFWGSAFTWDYFQTLICISVMVACLFIFEDYRAFTNHGGAGAAFLIMAVYGVGSISFSYLLSLLSQTPAGGFALLTILHIITGTGFAIGVFVLQDDISLVNTSKIIGWLGRIFPTFGVAKSLMVYARISTKNSRCSPIPHLVWSYTDGTIYESGYYVYVPPSLPGIGQELIFMGLMAVIYTSILMLVEYGWMKRLLNKVWKQNAMDFISNTVDNDVLEENARVKSLIERGKTAEDALVVGNISKSYGNFCAVSKLSFGVHHGECFGLLGVNGAGKTTTFKMLTGDEIISFGDAWLQNLSLQSDRKEFLSKIAYCPQFDGIIGVLSGFQMLQLFARLRGVKSSNIDSDCATWLDRFGLLDSGKVQCHKYSGGMKRRLTAAMAMVGDPPILLLDEPTSGVDPVSRKNFWNIISKLKSMGKSIILTSHSMEECEFLCERLGIMVNGEYQCMGRVQHLKNKFAQGYTLTMQIKPGDQMQLDGFVRRLVDQVTSEFSPCILKDHHQNVVQFHIQSTAFRLDEVFERMEQIKNRFVDYIEDYSVQQTTLEEVFLSFARKQYTAPREVQQTSRFRKFVASVFGC